MLGSAQNFGQGAQFASASNVEITYRMNYMITCATPVTVTIARETLLAYAQDRAKTGKGVKALTLGTLLSWSLGRAPKG